MTAKIGIPRALGYYYLYPFYKTLLEELGNEVMVSPRTTKAILDRMESCPTDEPCIGVKLYFAHTEKLIDQGVDYIFSPVLVSMEKNNFCCPKFLGISDMIRNGLQIDDSMMLAPRFDRRSTKRDSSKPFYEMAAKLGITDKGRVNKALKSAHNVQRRYEDLMVSDKLTCDEALRLLDGSKPVNVQQRNGQTIGVIGHPYILYDMLSHDMIPRIREFGDVITSEMVPKHDVDTVMENIPEGSKMWSFEARMLGAAIYLLREHLIDKLILVGSFECGPESIIESYIESEAEHQGIPFLLLTVDEQTGEAGLITRIEAFMDTSSGINATPIQGSKGGSLTVDTAKPVFSPTTIKNGMVVGFPSMGYIDIAIRSMLQDCGTECIKTPAISKHTIELGSELAPEFVCFPLTATMGQMRELLDAGANTLFMVGGKGRCRLGWYAQVEEQLLRKAGYEFDMVILDSPVPFRTHWGSFARSLKQITGDSSWPKIIKAFKFAYRKLLALDHAEELCRRMRAYERNRGTADRLFDRFVRRMDRAADTRTVDRETHDFEEAIQSIEIENTDPLKVRVVGEIWVVLERLVNQEMEKMLASQDTIRVEVERDLSASQWFRQNVLSDPAVKAREEVIRHAASTYLSEQVGGHGQETVGETVLARQEGFDGVVHIFPFTCMPEIVAQNILVKVSEDLDIPILTYIVSEQTGEAGIQTRVEAFLDILEERRRWRRSRA
ncbi:MAG: acyl-CoA dehydratase activase-related protein [Armatimonadota bacterium]